MYACSSHPQPQPSTQPTLVYSPPSMWFTDITPSDVTFKEELGLSDYAQVLLVDIRGHTCVMKVVSQHLFPC